MMAIIMRNDVLVVIRDTLEDVQGIKILSMYVEDNIVFGIYVNKVQDTLSFLSLPKQHFETVINGINIQFFELGTVLHNIYFNGALKFLDILHSNTKIIEPTIKYIDLCKLVLENIPFNIAKLNYINAFNKNFNYETDVEKVSMLMDVALNLNLTLLTWNNNNMQDFYYVKDIDNENDFIKACNSLNVFKQWLQSQSFAKISEKNINCIDQMYIKIQISYMKI